MKLKLSFLFIFVISYSWSQTVSQTFDTSDTFVVPAGVTTLNIRAWGGGGAGGGSTAATGIQAFNGSGGGGAAYVINTLSVTPGATLNVIVAGDTPGTTGNGTAGGFSTIEGYESSILAAGGLGGQAADGFFGTKPGGAGGKSTDSNGSIKYDGENGGNGRSGLLSLDIYSGSGGGSPYGGVLAYQLYLLASDGRNGNAPGGGGAGGMSRSPSGTHIGGKGAHGRVIISYETPAFAANSTSDSMISVDSAKKVINVETFNQNIDKIFVYDLSGNLVYKKSGVGNSKHDIEGLKSNNQILIVKVTLDNNLTQTKKIIY